MVLCNSHITNETAGSWKSCAVFKDIFDCWNHYSLEWETWKCPSGDVPPCTAGRPIKTGQISNKAWIAFASWLNLLQFLAQLGEANGIVKHLHLSIGRYKTQNSGRRATGSSSIFSDFITPTHVLLSSHFILLKHHILRNVFHNWA